MIDSFTRKNYFGQEIGSGFELDVYTVVGAPKESFVKISRAEPGGVNSIGAWRPVGMGLRPTLESDAMKKFLEGGYIKS